MEEVHTRQAPHVLPLLQDGQADGALLLCVLLVRPLLLLLLLLLQRRAVAMTHVARRPTHTSANTRSAHTQNKDPLAANVFLAAQRGAAENNTPDTPVRGYSIVVPRRKHFGFRLV